MSIISAGNTLLHTFVPDICLVNDLEEGQILVFDETLQAFINTKLDDEIDSGNIFRKLDTLEIYNAVGDGFRTTFSIPWETDNKDLLLVTINGSIQHIDAYDLQTFSGFTNVVFSEPINVDDAVEIIGLQIESSANIDKFTIIADGVSDTYTIPWVAPSEQSLIISLDSAKQHDDAYLINVVGTSTDIKFDEIPAVGTKIEVLAISSTFVQRYTTTANGTDTDFTIPWAATGKESLVITIDAVKQHVDSYLLTVSQVDSLISFDEAPFAGQEIEFIGFTNLSSTIQEVTGIDVSNVTCGLGTEEGIFRDITCSGTTQLINLKSLVPGPGIELSSNSNCITISTVAGSEMVNIGSGEEILKYSPTDVPQFKTLKGDGSVTVYDNCDELVIVYDGDADTLGSYPASHYIRTIKSCGVGKSIVKKGSGQTDSTAKLKTLVGGENILISETPDEIVISNLSGGDYVNVITDYNIQPTDYIVGVADTSTNRNIYLPLAACAGPGKKVLVKDESGNAGTNNITIHAQSGQMIDDQTLTTISSDYGFVEFYSNGFNWFVCNRA